MRLLQHTLTLCVSAALFSQTALAMPDPASVFQQRWQQHDQLVAEGQASRSWTWGPAPITGVVEQSYQDQAGGEWHTRNVQYFDKGRMEINDPGGDDSSLWYVTSGRLPVDLMLAPTEWDQNSSKWKDSYITAAGDPGNFPTYRDLQPLYESPGLPRPERLNQPATDLLEPNLQISHFTQYASDPATILRQGENSHVVPQAFLDFMNQSGPMLRGGQRISGQIYDPLYIFGLPVTPAVWVRARVGGTLTPVLMQVFERRVLTYNPANQAAFRVEMGNVGAHYYNWSSSADSDREFIYQGDSTVVAAQDANVVYTLDVSIHQIAVGGGSTPNTPDSADYTVYRSLDGGKTREPRFSGKLGPSCWTTLRVVLLAPRSPQSDPGRIGLMTACAQNPSAARGFGTTIYSSYDGGATFFSRGGA